MGDAEKKDRQWLFAEYVTEFGPGLHAFARRLLPEEDLASDITQEVFLKLWENRARWHTLDSVGAWLYRVAENKIIDQLRRKSTERKSREKLLRKAPGPVSDPANLFENRESGELIRRAVSQLPERRQRIYLLHNENSLSYREIADEMHISPHTVKNQLASALAFLRNCLRNLRAQ